MTATHVKATSRYVRIAPNKIRQVAMHIRGQRVEAARRLLLVSPKDAAQPVLKTLNSAIANAEHNHDLDADDLFVTAAIVDEGPMLKRFQPRAMGRAYRIRKRTSHITISVGTENSAPPRINRAAEGRRAARRASQERAGITPGEGSTSATAAGSTSATAAGSTTTATAEQE